MESYSRAVGIASKKEAGTKREKNCTISSFEVANSKLKILTKFKVVFYPNLKLQYKVVTLLNIFRNNNNLNKSHSYDYIL